MEEIIDPRQLLVKVVEVLEELRVPYAVTGGMAVFVWGRPRFTADIDIIVMLKLENIHLFAEKLKKLSEVSYISQESIQRALKQRGEFNFIDGTSGIKIDFWVCKGDVFSNGQLQRRVGKTILGRKVFFVSPEDLILSKLFWYKESASERQLEDVKSVIKIQKKLDWIYLIKWAKKQSAFKVLEELKRLHDAVL